MKVCTDACLFGALFAEKTGDVSTILDIGSGTGLLMMMLAQKTTAVIHGIELNASCFEQMKENLAQNDWKGRLTAFQGDIRTYIFAGKYDFIICNPPFFEHDLSSSTEEENIAKHSWQLTLEDLVPVIERHLATDGSFGILLPYHRWEYFNTICQEQHFHLREKIFISHSPAHALSRAILHFCRDKQETASSYSISIRQPEGDKYSKEFIELMKDYYLYL